MYITLQWEIRKSIRLIISGSFYKVDFFYLMHADTNDDQPSNGAECEILIS